MILLLLNKWRVYFVSSQWFSQLECVEALWKIRSCASPEQHKDKYNRLSRNSQFSVWNRLANQSLQFSAKKTLIEVLVFLVFIIIIFLQNAGRGFSNICKMLMLGSYSHI